MTMNASRKENFGRAMDAVTGLSVVTMDRVEGDTFYPMDLILMALERSQAIRVIDSYTLIGYDVPASARKYADSLLPVPSVRLESI